MCRHAMRQRATAVAKVINASWGFPTKRAARKGRRASIAPTAAERVSTDTVLIDAEGVYQNFPRILWFDREADEPCKVQDWSWRGSRGAEPLVGLGETQRNADKHPLRRCGARV